MRPSSLRSLGPLLSIAVAACGGSADRTGEASPGGTGPTRGPDAVACGDRPASAHTFLRVTDAASATAYNACGDVAFIDLDGNVTVQRIEMSAPLQLAHVTNPGSAPGRAVALSPSGKYVAYSAEDGVHQLAVEQRVDEAVFPITEPTQFAFATAPEPGGGQREVLVLCGEQAGLRLAGDGGQRSASCAELLAQGGPFAVAREGHQLTSKVLALDARDGSVRRYDELTEGLVAAGPMQSDQVALSLSDDGRTLIFERTGVEQGGDYFAPVDLRARLVDLDSGEIGPTLWLQKGMVPSGASARDFLVPPGPHRLALRTVSGFAWQDGAGASHEGPRSGLLAISPDGASGLFLTSTGKTKSLVESKLTGSGETLLSANADSVLGTDDLAHVFVGKVPVDGIHYPNDPGVTHAQLWELARLTNGHEQTLAASTQPLRPVWVGDDGSALIFGPLAEVPLPTVAAPEDVPKETYGIHAFDAAGERVATVAWSDGPRTSLVAKAGLYVETYGGTATGVRMTYFPGQGGSVDLAAPAASSGLDRVETRLVTSDGDGLVIIGRGDGATTASVAYAGALPR